jgi:hypothetical protein
LTLSRIDVASSVVPAACCIPSCRAAAAKRFGIGGVRGASPALPGRTLRFGATPRVGPHPMWPPHIRVLPHDKSGGLGPEAFAELRLQP